MSSRALQIIITTDNKDAKKGFDDLESHMDASGRKLQVAGLKLSAAITAPVLLFAKAAIDELKQSEAVSAQTTAAIRSTGGAANISAKEIDGLASSLMKKSGMDDEAIKSGANLLLTFTAVKNVAGEGNDVFNQGVKAAQNLSVAFGKDMADSAILVGKALNDPIAGVSALRRVGVQLTDQQKESIQAFMDQGDVMSAQKVILKELNTQVGGSAEAYGKTMGGQVALAREEFRNASATMITVAAPAIRFLSGAVHDLSEFLNDLSPEMREFLVITLGTAAAVGPLAGAVGSSVRGFSDLIRVSKGLKSGLESVYVGALLAKDGLREMTLAQGAATLGAGLLVGAAITAAITMGDDFSAGLQKATDAGAKWAQTTIIGAKATGDELGALKSQLEFWVAEQKQAIASGDLSAKQIARMAGEYNGLSKEIKSLELKQKEAEAADKARKVAIDELARGTKTYADVTDDALNAVRGLRDQELAAAGGELGYRQALLNVQKAQEDYTKAVKEHGPASDEVREAELRLQQAQLSSVQAAISATDSQEDLIRKYKESPEALQVAIDKLNEEKRVHHEVAPAIQEQINKLLDLKKKLDELPEYKALAIDVKVRQFAADLQAYDIERGYASGTTSARRGLAWAGEDGPELIDFGGGETVLPTGPSLALARAAAAPPIYLQVIVDPITGEVMVNTLLDHASTNGDVFQRAS